MSENDLRQARELLEQHRRSTSMEARAAAAAQAQAWVAIHNAETYRSSIR